MKGMLIDGRYTSGEATERIVMIYPATEEVIGILTNKFFLLENEGILYGKSFVCTWI